MAIPFKSALTTSKVNLTKENIKNLIYQIKRATINGSFIHL